MSIYRSYLSKNNTIIRNSLANSSKSPSVILKYGTNFSKYIFQIDLSLLKAKIANGEVILNNNTNHFVHFTNCVFGDETLLGKTDDSSSSQRASSFDLIIFKLHQDFDEGVGYEEQAVDMLDPLNKLYSENPSNWYNATSQSGWTETGIYTTNLTGGTTADIITYQHFDNGSENLHVDITNYINSILTGNTVHYGLGIAFSSVFEVLTALPYDQSVSFFSKYTQTFYEPYLETVYNDLVQDNRNDFIIGKPQTLCLYVNQNGVLTDLDNLPLVDLLSYDKKTLTGFTNLNTFKISKGIYGVSVTLTGQTLCDDKMFYFDVWKNLFIGGILIPNQTLKFIPNELDDSVIFSSKSLITTKYVPFIYGIKRDEKIISGEKRKVIVEIKEMITGKKKISDKVYYRIYIREGNNQIDVISWSQVNKTDSGNNFYLDTEFLIPREYYLDLKITENNEVSIIKEQIKFQIVGLK